MKFSELEQKMSQVGINSLAEISRHLDTTPQAVSNWKSRNQVPYHVVAKVLNYNESEAIKTKQPDIVQKNYDYAAGINFTDIFHCLIFSKIDCSTVVDLPVEEFSSLIFNISSIFFVLLLRLSVEPG